MADVKDSKFVLGNATVMLAPMSTDVHSLNVDDHSLGMVKAVTLTQESDQVTLKNGVSQVTVDSQKSNVNMTATFEVYEFTAKNVMYSLGLQGAVVKRLRGKLTAAAATGATSLSVESFPVTGDPQSLIDAVGDIPNGATLMLQKAKDSASVYPCKVKAETTGAGPYVVTIDALPTGVSFEAGDIVWVVNKLHAGSMNQDEYFCAKIVGTLTANNEPIVIFFPKVKVSKGFNLNFGEQDYSNMPFELSPMVMSRTEVAGRPEFQDFRTNLAEVYIGG